MSEGARERFLALLRRAVEQGELAKLTLGRHRGADATLRNLFVRPVTIKAGPRLAFLWRHATRDVTKNHPPAEGLALIELLVGADFLDAHLFTAKETAQLECQPDGTARLRLLAAAPARPAETTHDRVKPRLIATDAPWLQALGVTNAAGRPREGMAGKFRQIEKFAEVLSHLLEESGFGSQAEPRLIGTVRPTHESPNNTPFSPSRPFQVVDMGCGKGYLTFAVSALLGDQARVRGIEVRPELVDLCNRIASEQGFGSRLTFAAGTIADTPLEGVDVLIALHACDTATDDALARGVAAGARLLVVAPCCHKELRPQLMAPPVLAGPLRHGIFQERHAEFVTDALRIELLEWAGYRTKAFEFISTEHTAKNLMIAAVKARPPGDPDAAGRIRTLAAFYGIRRQSLALPLGLELT